MPADAIVVGAGPNGLAAAIAIAQTGRAVRVYEAESTIGGGTRSAELTRPGFVHDVCATVHALALASPFLKTLPLADHGLAFAHPGVPCAHPFDDGTAIAVRRSVPETAEGLSRSDGAAYRSLLSPFVDGSDELMHDLLAPIRPRASWLMSRFSLAAVRSATGLARAHFADARSRAVFAGVAAHGLVPLDKLGTGGFGLGLLVTAHAVGWPVARGGSQYLGGAMAAYLRSLGGEIQTGARIDSLGDLPAAHAVLLDVTPRQLVQIAGDRAPMGYRQRLARYRYGPGVFKMDWALNAPVPWRARECDGAGTVHIGGSAEEIAFSEHEVWQGRLVDKPYAIVVQPSRFDPTRAPAGQHTLWAYCHVPNGSAADMRERIERQIERFAPGFRDCIIGASALGPAELEQRNANLVGGDIAGGAADLWQFLTRPTLSIDPYKTAVDGVYLCSASTPPGVGVHGMCGYHAAQSALRALG